MLARYILHKKNLNTRGKVIYEDLEAGQANETDATMIRKDGTIFYVHIAMKAVDPSDPSKGTIAAITDISDRKRAEQALMESEAKYKAIFLGASEGILVADPLTTEFKYANPAVCNMLGYTEDELVGLNLSAIHPKDKLDDVLAEFQAMARREKSKAEGVPCLRKDGTIFYASVGGASITIDGLPYSVGLFSDITERKKAEEAQRSSETFLNSVIDQSPYPMWISDDQGTLIRTNKALRDLLQISDEEVVGKYNVLRDNIVEEQGSLPLLKSVFERGDTVRFELRYDTSQLKNIQLRQSAFVILDVTVFPIKGSYGKTTNAVIQHMDITARKTAENALRESEEKYRILVENANEGVLVSQNEVIRFLNQRTAEIVGYDEQELLSKPFTEFVHPDDKQKVIEYQVRRLKGEKFPERYPFRILTKDGTSKWVEIDVALIQWEKSPATLVLISDVTERKQAEQAIKESEEWYRSIVEESFDGIFVQKGPKIVYANSVLSEMLGYSKGELEGIDHWLIYHPDDQETCRERAIARMRGEMLSHQYKVKLQRKDGSHFDGEVNARAVTVKGEPGVRVWVRDVSKQKRMEEVQRRLATAIEQSAEAVVITDFQGNVEYVNPAYERITGFAREEAIGSLAPLLREHELETELRRELSNSIARGAAWSGRTAGRRKDGTLYDKDVTISPVRDPRGKIMNFVGLERDVTQEVRLQQQLLQAQKMEAIGTLAGGIAHDFNNILTVVLGFSDLLLARKTKKTRTVRTFERYCVRQRTEPTWCSGSSCSAGSQSQSRSP